MKQQIKTLKVIVLAISFLNISNLSAQSKEKIAHDKGLEAVKLIDQGQYKEAEKLLKEAQKLDPKNIDFPYEIAYSQYSQADYKGAIKTLEALLKRKDINHQVYQLLGNSYSMSGNRDKAIKTYESGIKEFPNSGRLYLERGNMEMFIKEYGKALKYYEKGIEVDPKFPSNYYWAAKIYLNSTEEVWGMIYGEIFMNLERNSKRTVEISELLYTIYKSEIQFVSDTSMSVSFSKNATITIKDMSDLENLKLPFGVGAYEPTLLMSIIGVKSIDLKSLNKIRESFLDNYYSTENNKRYPNVLFDYQKQIQKAGHLEAYNYWILMKGDEPGFVAWKDANVAKWDAFVKWFSENALKLSMDNRFYREQY